MDIFDSNVKIVGVSQLEHNTAENGGEYTRTCILFKHGMMMYKIMIRETIGSKESQQEGHWLLDRKWWEYSISTHTLHALRISLLHLSRH